MLLSRLQINSRSKSGQGASFSGRGPGGAANGRLRGIDEQSSEEEPDPLDRYDQEAKQLTNAQIKKAQKDVKIAERRANKKRQARALNASRKQE